MHLRTRTMSGGGRSGLFFVEINTSGGGSGGNDDMGKDNKGNDGMGDDDGGNKKPGKPMDKPKPNKGGMDKDPGKDYKKPNNTMPMPPATNTTDGRPKPTSTTSMPVSTTWTIQPTPTTTTMPNQNGSGIGNTTFRDVTTCALNGITKCPCDWRIQANNCTNDVFWRGVYTANIAFGSLVLLGFAGLIFYRLKHQRRPLTLPVGERAAGRFRPQPVEAMIVSCTAFVAARWLFGILIVTGTIQRFTASELIQEIAWPFLYVGAALLIVGVTYEYSGPLYCASTLRHLHPVTEEALRTDVCKWRPDARLLDAVAWTVLGLSLIGVILAVMTGITRDDGNGAAADSILLARHVIAVLVTWGLAAFACYISVRLTTALMTTASALRQGLKRDDSQIAGSYRATEMTRQVRFLIERTAENATTVKVTFCGLAVFLVVAGLVILIYGAFRRGLITSSSGFSNFLGIMWILTPPIALCLLMAVVLVNTARSAMMYKQYSELADSENPSQSPFPNTSLTVPRIVMTDAEEQDSSENDNVEMARHQSDHLLPPMSIRHRASQSSFVEDVFSSLGWSRDNSRKSSTWSPRSSMRNPVESLLDRITRDPFKPFRNLHRSVEFLDRSASSQYSQQSEMVELQESKQAYDVSGQQPPQDAVQRVDNMEDSVQPDNMKRDSMRSDDASSLMNRSSREMYDEYTKRMSAVLDRQLDADSTHEQNMDSDSETILLRQQTEVHSLTIPTRMAKSPKLIPTEETDLSSKYLEPINLRPASPGRQMPMTPTFGPTVDDSDSTGTNVPKIVLPEGNESMARASPKPVPMVARRLSFISLSRESPHPPPSTPPPTAPLPSPPLLQVPPTPGTPPSLSEITRARLVSNPYQVVTPQLRLFESAAIKRGRRIAIGGPPNQGSSPVVVPTQSSSDPTKQVSTSESSQLSDSKSTSQSTDQPTSQSSGQSTDQPTSQSTGQSTSALALPPRSHPEFDASSMVGFSNTADSPVFPPAVILKSPLYAGERRVSMLGAEVSDVLVDDFYGTSAYGYNYYASVEDEARNERSSKAVPPHVQVKLLAKRKNAPSMPSTSGRETPNADTRNENKDIEILKDTRGGDVSISTVLGGSDKSGSDNSSPDTWEGTTAETMESTAYGMYDPTTPTLVAYHQTRLSSMSSSSGGSSGNGLPDSPTLASSPSSGELTTTRIKRSRSQSSLRRVSPARRENRSDDDEPTEILGYAI